jgi:hypothetical protein
MFDMARGNLREAVTIRNNDPAAHYFYGKVMELVGRTPEEHKEALTAFANAVKFDYRHQNYGADLHYGLALMDDAQPNKQAVSEELDKYVTDYASWQVENRQTVYFPPNLESIYEYMRLYGDPGWRPKPPDLTKVTNYVQSLETYIGQAPPPVSPDAPPKALTVATPAVPPKDGGIGKDSVKCGVAGAAAGGVKGAVVGAGACAAVNVVKGGAATTPPKKQ